MVREGGEGGQRDISVSRKIYMQNSKTFLSELTREIKLTDYFPRKKKRVLATKKSIQEKKLKERLFKILKKNLIKQLWK